jgi:hypothetical protein
MNDQNLLPLLEKYIEGTLDDAGRAELEKQIVSSIEARRIFWEYLEQHAFIGELGGEAKGRALARLEKPPTRRTPATPRSTARRPNATPFLIAAGLLIGFVVILIASMSGSDADEARSLAAFRAKQTERRKAAEARLREIEQERQKLLSRPVAPEGKPEPAKEEERKKALEDLADRQRKVDEELRQALVQEKPRTTIEQKPEEPKPLFVPEKTTTVAAAVVPVARIAKVEGKALVDQKPAAAGLELAAGQRLDTGNGSLELLYADGTRVVFGPGTVARDFKAEGGKRFWVEIGSLLAVVSKQPKGQPLVVDTPTSEATVVGTTLRIKVDPELAKGMRLEVEEGTVQLKNRLNGRLVLVESGHFAVAASGGELKSQLLPIDEILVTAAQAKVTGGEWRVAKNADMPVGIVLESVAMLRKGADLSQLPSYVTMTFEAEANRDYDIWVRGVCVGSGDRALMDCVIIKFARAQVTQLKPVVDWAVNPGADGVMLGGWGRATGTRWIGGDGDFFDKSGFRVEPTKGTGRLGDEMAASVRFARPGLQTLRMYLLEGPMRIDAVWLSTTQKTRPDAAQVGPVK